MRLKKWCLILVCVAWTSGGYSQDYVFLSDEDSIHQYVNRFYDTIVNHIYNWEDRCTKSITNERRHPGLTIDSLELFPFVKVQIVSDRHNEPLVNRVRFTSSSPINAIVYPHFKVYSYDLGRGPQFGLVAAGDVFMDFVQEAKKKGFSEIAFCYFLDEEKYQRNIIFENKDGKYRFFLKRVDSVLSIKDIIARKYHSFENLLLAMHYEELRHRALEHFNVQLDHSEHIRGSWRFRYLYLPEDTLGVLDSMLHGIKEFIPKVSSQQMKQLRSRLKEVLYKPENYTDRRKSWSERKRLVNSYLKSEADSVIQSILTKEQYIIYQDYAFIGSFLHREVDNYVYYMGMKALFAKKKERMDNPDITKELFAQWQMEYINKLLVQH